METNNGQLWERTYTPFPDLKPLPALKSIDQYVTDANGGQPTFGTGGTVDRWLGRNVPGWSAATGTADAVSSAFDILTNPKRVITVVVGLIFLAGGLYILGQSGLADAIRRAARS